MVGLAYALPTLRPVQLQANSKIAKIANLADGEVPLPNVVKFRYGSNQEARSPIGWRSSNPVLAFKQDETYLIAAKGLVDQSTAAYFLSSFSGRFSRSFFCTLGGSGLPP